MTDKKRTEAKDNVIKFVESKKNQYIYYDHWISGGSTIVYPITSYFHDDGKSVTIQIQMGDCDARNWRGFENVLKKKFPYVKSAYYCKYDGSCPNEYRIEIKID